MVLKGRKLSKLAGGFLIGAVLIVIYQNCDGNGFKAIGNQSLSSSVSAGVPLGSETANFDQLKKIVDSSVPKGQWYELKGTELISHYITYDETMAIHPKIWGEQGPDCVLQCWTSSSFDGRYWYFGPGGGHRGYNGNEIYRFDLNTLTWKRLYDPSPLIESPEFDAPPVWGPPALHNYDGLIYSPKTNSIFAFSAGVSWEYKIGVEDPKAAWTPFEGPDKYLKGYVYIKTALLKDQNILVTLSGDANVAIFDPVTRTYSRYHPWVFGGGSYSVADTRTKNNKVYLPTFYDAGGVIEIDSNADLPGGSTMPHSSPPPGLGDGTCFLYHPPSDRFIAWRKGRTVSVFNPDKSEWTVLPNVDGPAYEPNVPNGPYQKCIYVKQLDVFMFMNDSRQGVWIWRPPEVMP